MRLKIFNFQFSIFNLVFGLLLILLLSVSPILAEEADSKISEEDVKEKIKERLEEVVDKGLEKVKGVMEEEKKSKLYAWVGTIKSVTDSVLSIETINGLKEAKVGTSAAILKVAPGKSKKKIKIGNIKSGQFAIAMGTRDENEVVLGKRIIILDEAPTPADERKIISGKVTEIDEEEVTIQKNGEAETLTINKKVKLKINGIKKPIVEDIQINDYLTAIVILDEKEEVELTKAVLVIPGKTNPQAEENEVTEEEIKSATPSTESTKEE